MRKIISLTLIFALLPSLVMTSFANSGAKTAAELMNDTTASAIEVDVPRAYLMEASTGTVLYSKNEYAAASPASVTKVMTLLLVCEALDDGVILLEDNVTISSYAASMGGSQVFLEEGERMSVEELIKCTVIASANDAAVALAELVAGNEDAFVNKMNERARSLGLKNTAFENVTGLDDTTTDHYSCPADIAKMSAELLKYDVILKYSSLWQDTIRNGEFTLTNTNRLVRYYEGCNGLKTGSTDKAGFCISATAKRGNMQLIAVIMGADTRDDRNNAARALLDYGFSNFALYEDPREYVEDALVSRGVSDSVALYSTDFSTVIPKNKIAKVDKVYNIPEKLSAPVFSGDVVGEIEYFIDGERIGTAEIFVDTYVAKINMWQIFARILKRITAG